MEINPNCIIIHTIEPPRGTSIFHISHPESALLSTSLVNSNGERERKRKRRCSNYSNEGLNRCRTIISVHSKLTTCIASHFWLIHIHLLQPTETFVWRLNHGFYTDLYSSQFMSTEQPNKRNFTHFI